MNNEINHLKDIPVYDAKYVLKMVKPQNRTYTLPIHETYSLKKTL